MLTSEAPREAGAVVLTVVVLCVLAPRRGSLGWVAAGPC